MFQINRQIEQFQATKIDVISTIGLLPEIFGAIGDMTAATFKALTSRKAQAIYKMAMFLVVATIVVIAFGLFAAAKLAWATHRPQVIAISLYGKAQAKRSVIFSRQQLAQWQAVARRRVSVEWQSTIGLWPLAVRGY
jgi:hypothetical protein